MIIDEIRQGLERHVRHRIWFVSDLQQRQPARARKCMQTAMDDFVSLKLQPEAVCYLGDATEGEDLGFIHEMAQMQVEQFARLDAPVWYTIGNHDFDYFRFHRKELPGMCIPFVDYVRKFPQWHVPDEAEMARFLDLGDIAVLLLTDHADPQGAWYTTHGEIHGYREEYPYHSDAYRKVMDDVLALKKPGVTCAHYAFAGGNREAPLFNRFLPLPENVRIHFYGHAHVGDAVWAGKDANRKISNVDGQPIVQVDVASLESGRGSAVRSVVFEWYDTDEIGVFFRNHSLGVWDDVLMVRSGDCQFIPLAE